MKPRIVNPPGSDYRAFISSIGVENASRYPDRRTHQRGGLSQLQEEFFRVFYDQRGAGLSPRFDEGVVDFETYLQDLDAVISLFLEKKWAETGIEENQVYLMGRSFGGTLATGYVNRFPERVKDADSFRTHYYPGAVDGWYWEPGGTFQFGIEGGRTIRERFDLHLEVKKPFTEAFNAYGGSPLHVNLGVGARLGR